LFLFFSFLIIVDIIWIVGDSIVHWAAHYLLPWGEAALNLHLDSRVSWKGLRGGHLTDLSLYLYDSLVRNHCGSCDWPCVHAPSFVVIHMGTNDLTTLDTMGFKFTLEDVIAECQFLLPHSIIVWSDILPRHFYKGAWSQPSMERKRKNVNRTARAIVLSNGGKVIRHDNIQWYLRSLFRSDLLHLDVFGHHLFTENLGAALKFFSRYPLEQIYRAGPRYSP